MYISDFLSLCYRPFCRVHPLQIPDFYVPGRVEQVDGTKHISAKLGARMSRIMQSKSLASVDDFEEAAKQILYGAAWYYYSRGVGGINQTRKDSREAFKRYRFRPRVLTADANSQTSLRTTVLGHSIEMPICIAPTALHGIAHHSKEHGAIKAAKSHGTVMVLSSISNTEVNTLHQEASQGLLWMQMYFFKTSALTEALIRRAEEAGFKALLVTVDSPGLHVNTPKKLARLASFDYLNSRDGVRAKNLDLERYEEKYGTDPMDRNLWNRSITEVNGSHATEEDIRWLKSFTKLPIVLKGILSAKTARIAVSLGVDGILVSAHGGRQLDGAPAPIDALADIVEAVQGSGVEVYMDGGIRNGTDVLKALALGARAVFVGRPALWGLAANGAEGVQEVLQILKDELKLAMMLSGVKDVRRVPSSIVFPESKYLASKL